MALLETLLLATACASIVAACSETVSPFCEPGTIMTCPCLGAGDGVQTCNMNGSAYGSCICDAGIPDATIDGGAEDASIPDAPSPIDSGSPDAGPDCGDIIAPGAWEPLPSITGAPTAPGAREPSLALDASGTPIVAFGAGSDAYAARLVDDMWLILSGGLGAYPGMTAAMTPALALDPAELPIVAWYETNPDPSVLGATDVFVSRLAPDVWVSMGGALSPLGGDSAAITPGVAVAPDGTPHIAFAESDPADGHDVIHVLRWDGTTWLPVGDPRDHDPMGAGNPTLAFGPDGAPHVAYWRDESGVTRAIVEHWDGTDWVALGAPVSRMPATTVSIPRFAFSRGGDPYLVVLGAGVGSSEAFRWNGTDWESLGSPDAGFGGVTSVGRTAIAFDATDRLLVAFEETVPAQRIHVRRRDATAWGTLGSALDDLTGSSVGTPMIATDSCGDPVVGYVVGTEIRLRRYVR